MKNDAVEEPGLDINNQIDPGAPTDIINQYEKIMKSENKKTVVYVAKQRHLLKKFKDKEYLTENAGRSKSILYFKIVLYRFFRKFHDLNTSALSIYCFSTSTPSIYYFRNTFKILKTFCPKNNSTLLSQTTRTAIIIL